MRITRRSEYLKITKGGRKSVRRFVVGYYMPRENSQGTTRLGITASKRIGKAHDRNLAKRRLREIFRMLHHELRPGVDLVLNTRVAINRAGYQKLEQDVRNCLQDLDLISTEPVSGDSCSGPSTDS